VKVRSTSACTIRAFSACVLKLGIVAFALLDPLNPVSAEVYYGDGPADTVRVHARLFLNEMIDSPYNPKSLKYIRIRRHLGRNHLKSAHTISSARGAAGVISIWAMLSDNFQLIGRVSSIWSIYLNSIYIDDIILEISKYNTNTKSVTLIIKGACCPFKTESNRKLTKEDLCDIVHGLWNCSPLFHLAVNDPSNRSIVSESKAAGSGPHHVPLDSDFASELILRALPGGNFTICPEHYVRGAPNNYDRRGECVCIQRQEMAIAINAVFISTFAFARKLTR
jgi:hypothetical protein